MTRFICLIQLWTLVYASETSSRELRIVLLGKSGDAKSAGNTILGTNAFKEVSFKSVTSASEMEMGKVHGRNVTLVVTPGLFDTSIELKSEVKKCVNLSLPGPHAFLLVIGSDVRYTEEEGNAIKWIQNNFGRRAAKFTMVLFTHGDQLKGKSDTDISTDIRTLINSFGGRYHVFNDAKTGDQTQVKELLEKIDAMVEENEGEYYTNKMYQEAQRKREEEQAKRQTEYQGILKKIYDYLLSFLNWGSWWDGWWSNANYAVTVPSVSIFELLKQLENTGMVEEHNKDKKTSLKGAL